jgi:hypothetical protein
MTTRTAPKLLPRNVAALRAGQDPSAPVVPVAGNPASTRLEAGIGNFFPGLECDLRNLERRFFPFLEVDTDFGSITIVAADAASAAAMPGLSATDRETYATLDWDARAGSPWFVRSLEGDFGPLGVQTVVLANLDGTSFGQARAPADAWVAIRMLKENAPVTLTLMRDGVADRVLVGARRPYLDANGSFARMFEPGELTQSLCSPWTHDFRDCACFYWASNHPDIALPPLPSPAPPETDRRWQRYTAWERANRSVDAPPVVTAAGAGPDVPAGSAAIEEMQHHQINRDWQQLNFVIDHREQLLPYKPSEDAGSQAPPLPDQATLIQHLRYAAGVELAVALEYLSAAWSLRKPDALPQPLRNDVQTAFAELLRIAIGEMRHLRAVNDALMQLQTLSGFEPALAVAADIPDGGAGAFRPLQFRAATQATIDDFIRVEAPSESVDGLYAPIYATLLAMPDQQEAAQSIRTVMSEGEDHFQTFQFIKEWLGRHAPDTTYLIGANLTAPPAGHPAHVQLQSRYLALLQGLHAGYQAGMPRGAPAVNDARQSMLGAMGIQGAFDAVAAAGFLAAFDPIADARFAPIPHP